MLGDLKLDVIGPRYYSVAGLDNRNFEPSASDNIYLTITVISFERHCLNLYL
jgi:hypothetical protein